MCSGSARTVPSHPKPSLSRWEALFGEAQDIHSIVSPLLSRQHISNSRIADNLGISIADIGAQPVLGDTHDGIGFRLHIGIGTESTSLVSKLTVSWELSVLSATLTASASYHECELLLAEDVISSAILMHATNATEVRAGETVLAAVTDITPSSGRAAQDGGNVTVSVSLRGFDVGSVSLDKNTELRVTAFAVAAGTLLNAPCRSNVTLVFACLLGPLLPVTGLQQATRAAFVASTVRSSLSGNPQTGMSNTVLASLQGVAQCSFSLLDAMDGPLYFSYGEEEGQYLRGAVAGGSRCL